MRYLFIITVLLSCGTKKSDPAPPTQTNAETKYLMQVNFNKPSKKLVITDNGDTIINYGPINQGTIAFPPTARSRNVKYYSDGLGTDITIKEYPLPPNYNTNTKVLLFFDNVDTGTLDLSSLLQ